jgi:hypothetical protein
MRRFLTLIFRSRHIGQDRRQRDKNRNAANRNAMHRLMNTTKPAPLRSSALSGGRAALVCAAMALSCAVLPGGGLKAQTTDPQAQAQATPAPAPAPAPIAAPQPKKSRNPTGSPLDTLMSTRLTADVPEAKDFVRQTRRPPETLDFKPTSGTDPERPKVRTKTELDALQSELEGAAQKNAARAGLRKAEKAAPAVASAQSGKQGEPKKPLPN